VLVVLVPFRIRVGLRLLYPLRRAEGGANVRGMAAVVLARPGGSVPPELEAHADKPLPMPTQRHPLTDLPRRLLDWLCEGRADYREFQRRKASRAYKTNQSICLIIWLIAALLLLVCGTAGCLLTLGLVATFLCFSLLDPE
jgi:hypothetical protein